jgi:hypothetical protein
MYLEGSRACDETGYIGKINLKAVHDAVCEAKVRA